MSHAHTRLFVVLALLLSSQLLVARAQSNATHEARSRQEVLDNWQKSRFGIFMHWGPSSVLELGSGSWRRADRPNPQTNKTQAEIPAAIFSGEYLKYKGQGGVPHVVYDNLFHVFNPTNFDAGAWAKLFKEAGAGYIIFTTKHHDGFCMYATKTQDYNIMNTPFRRDITRELVDACRAEGIPVIFYYSPVDWWNPEFRSGRKDTSYVDSHFLPQVEELLTQYGPIDGLWWDGGDMSKAVVKKTLDLIDKYQPWIIQNGRLGDGAGGQFGTPEQSLGEFNMKQRWESCMTMTGDSWFWNGGKNYKSSTTCIRFLIACASGDGNLALDVGPRADGKIDDRAVANFRDMGRWLDQYGQTIRGTHGGPYKPGIWGGSTRKGNKVYLHITEILESGSLCLPALPANVTAARTLTGGKVQIKQNEDDLQLSLSEQAPIDTIVELTLDSDSMAIKPIDTEKAGASHSLTDNATGSSSSLRNNNASCVVAHSWEKDGATLHFGEPGYEEQQAAIARKPPLKDGFGWANNHLGHVFRYWQASNEDKSTWVELQFASPKNFSQISLTENHSHTDGFAFDAFVDGAWKTLFADGEMGLYNRKLKTPVTTDKIRIRFLKTNGPVALTSVMLYK